MRQRSTLPGLARTECHEENSTSALRLWHRSSTNTTSIHFLRSCRRECPRPGTFSAELQFWGTGVRTHAVAGKGGSSGSDVDMVASLRLARVGCSKAFQTQTSLQNCRGVVNFLTDNLIFLFVMEPKACFPNCSFSVLGLFDRTV